MVTLVCPECKREYETMNSEVYCRGDFSKSTIGHKLKRMVPK